MATQTLKDSVPPHNPEAEWAALGGMLLENDAVSRAVSALRPDDFYSLANGCVFRAIQNLQDKAQRADIISVCEELSRIKQLDAAGGEAYIASLTSKVPTAENIDYYIGVIRDNSLRRALIKIASKITAKAYDISQNSEEILGKSLQFIHELLEERQRLQYKTIRELITNTLPAMEEMLENDFTGIRCGFDGIDFLTRGFQKSEMIVIGARPSIGKTALALNMAANIAFQQQKPTAFFSLEMRDILLTTRLLSSGALVDINAIRKQNPEQKNENFQRIINEAHRIHSAPLFIEDVPNMQLTDLRTQARYIREKEKVEIIFIDYLGLIGMENSSAPRFEQVTEISRSIKGLARELKIPIVVLSQLARGAEDQSPTLAQLRDSGSVEQDADVVILLHRDRKLIPDPGKDFVLTSVDIAKNRNGPTGNLELAYKPKFTRFDRYDKAEDRN